jgi:putative tryptophan/tyrosine transport system substrate-binding protein
MTRREFITLLGGAAAVWPLAARAQQSAMPVIGFIVAGTPLSHGQWVAAIVQRLRELGWIEGRTIAIEYRWGEGRNERFAEIAAEFVRRKVDVIVTSATAAVVVAKQATSVIPIVFAAAGDPVGTGLVASLARPGGNITGLSNQVPDLAGKRLELLREIVPGLGRLAILANVGNPVVVFDMRAARALGLEVITLEIRRGEDIVPAFEALNGRGGGALCRFRRAREYPPFSHQYVGAGRATADDAHVSGRGRSGRSDVLWSKLPGRRPRECRRCTCFGKGSKVGGLMSFGANFPDA